MPLVRLHNSSHSRYGGDLKASKRVKQMASAGDVLNKENTEKALYPAPGLPGGGQLEVRMEISPDHPDPDIRGVARRVKFFNLESWHKEWTEVAKKNEELAASFEQDNRKQTAHEFYLRAADSDRRAVVYM